MSDSDRKYMEILSAVRQTTKIGLGSIFVGFRMKNYFVFLFFIFLLNFTGFCPMSFCLARGSNFKRQGVELFETESTELRHNSINMCLVRKDRF